MKVDKENVGVEKAEESKENRFKKFLIGALTTFIMSVLAKAIALMFASETFDGMIHNLFSYFPFLVSLITASVTSGYFAQKWTGGSC